MKSETIKDLRRLANLLFQGPCGNVTRHGGKPCLETERQRPYTRGEVFQFCITEPGNPRGFASFNTDRMCLDCRTYWYAEMAAQSAERNEALAESGGVR